MKVDFDRERRWWNAKAPKEEQEMFDEAVNRALRWRVIERNLDGVKTILDVGAGTGVFSIPLAKRGFQVTHLDFSPAMLDLARKKAGKIPNITFIEANAVDLSAFPDRSFDLVLNTDGAISFCGSEAEQALHESSRVARKKLIVTVTNRVCTIPSWIEGCMFAIGDFHPAIYEMLDHGTWHQDNSPDSCKLTKGMTQDYFGALKAFMLDELSDLLVKFGMNVLRCGGLGSLAHLCGTKTVDMIKEDDQLFEKFLDLCERFDAEILPNGPGTRGRAGLIAVAERLS